MDALSDQGKNYEVDSDGFLLDYAQWDEDFARALAPRLSITGELTEEHWKVIRYIRNFYETTGKCPLVYQTCKMNRLFLKDLKALFPTGYLRGACKLAGITYKEGYVKYSWALAADNERKAEAEKTYRVDARGFLLDPSEWNPGFARLRAEEMNLPGGLTAKHWQIIDYLRGIYAKNLTIPTIYQTCEDNHLELAELELLFPNGYHRGAVKLAGLRER